METINTKILSEYIVKQIENEIRTSAHMEHPRSGDYRIGLKKAIDICIRSIDEIDNDK